MTTRRGTIASHARLDDIRAALEAGQSVTKVAQEFGVGKDALWGWWRNEQQKVENQEGNDLAHALRIERRRRENAERRTKVLEAQLRDLEAESDDLAEIANLIRSADDREAATPEWLAPRAPKRGHRGTVNLVLSDLHLDEVVKPEAVRGVNAYNRRIAEMRLKRTFEKAVALPRDYLSGLTYDGIVVHLAGDTFSGDIHEELARTNEATPIETLLYWLDPMVAGLRMLAEAYGKVHVVSVPGNHDRTSRKPMMKGRVETSMHFLFSKILERELAGVKNMTFDIPMSADALTVVHNTRIMTTHGDQFKGGNGIGGILVPILRGDARKRQRQSAVGEPYDLLVMGHFHQYIAGPGVLINGSVKGTDEFSFINNFSFEPPQQALFVVTPEHGASFHMPIQCSDRKAEGW